MDDQITKKESSTKYRHLSKDVSDNLKEVLGGNYYPDFVEMWKKTFPRVKKIPTRPTVGNIINGVYSNKRILETLYKMAEESIELKSSLTRLVSAN